ncbi:hypothetical protein [Pseudomonas oryzihabitans]|uniref:hypothetical protein n=1 Tax=Pseudomonas oryzihabitans TaxID=47885 RepID=UPI00214E6480|nr:hypothetical protein [Pseudomonas psychrotolerans]UUW72400.1 hypothetical protein NRG74_03045 [Pseudomonas psychrotolerans]
MRAYGFVFAIAACSVNLAHADSDIKCKNLIKAPYNTTPHFFAPDNTRGIGIKIWMNGKITEIPDTRAACLPIALRYNNPGALKTPSAGPWPNQQGKDTRGHAIFTDVQSGIRAWGLWFKKKYDSKVPQTAMNIMSIYAPPNDCVGSVGVYPNCPYGINPTREYATRLASSVHKGPDERLNIDGKDCKEGRPALYAIFTEIATFEIGANFCGRESKTLSPQCVVDKKIFDKAMDAVWGPIRADTCRIES